VRCSIALRARADEHVVVAVERLIDGPAHLQAQGLRRAREDGEPGGGGEDPEQQRQRARPAVHQLAEDHPPHAAVTSPGGRLGHYVGTMGTGAETVET
jgi:hypothetical protein